MGKRNKSKSASGGDTSKPKPVSSANGARRPVTDDTRFARIHYDPRFQRTKKDAVKIDLDDRFKHMMTSEEFSGKPKVDQYGRKLQDNAGQHELKRYYRIKDEGEEKEKEDDSASAESDSEESEEEYSDQELDAQVAASTSEESASEEESEESESDEDTMPKARNYDPMRGEGVSSSSEESDSDEVDGDHDEMAAEDGEGEHGEDDDEVPLGDATKRIGVVNLDWDHLKASDLFTIFNGFKPDGSAIHSVKIYTSEFGKERLEQEAREGPPKEIFNRDDDSDSDNSDDEVTEESLFKNDDGEEFNKDALRKYQLERLRYYFAVVECDKVSTAQAIYDQCDGAEVEATSNFFDLRFIPDDMEFNEKPVGVATSTSENHKRLEFATQALQHSNITLTWDDDDPDRVKTLRQKFNKNDLQDMDFKAYLASSSGESDNEDVETMRQRYKTLLNEAANDDEEKEKMPEGDMEITFTPGLSETASELLEKKKTREEQKEETTLEKYMRKQREKRQARKEKNKQKTTSTTLSEEAPFSDDEVDMDDPYFREAMEEEGFAVEPMTNGKNKDKKSKKKQTLTAEEKLERDRERAELELLLMDSKDDREHFDMKKIVKHEKNKGKKQRHKRNKHDDGDDDGDELQDSFKMDVSDPRFTALHESHHFAIDPTNPQFKKTNAMKQLLDERQRRNLSNSKKETSDFDKTQDTKSDTTRHSDKGLAMLVNSIKRKNTSNKPKGDIRKRTRIV
ncbi:hypothetical protein BDF22DRAFT_687666 [Syncephalis plumigaleata]|nr:hypothetical protein BDF22DRAFT_687666 [Syncephalis plumigaleata]